MNLIRVGRFHINTEQIAFLSEFPKGVKIYFVASNDSSSNKLELAGEEADIFRRWLRKNSAEVPK